MANRRGAIVVLVLLLIFLFFPDSQSPSHGTKSQLDLAVSTELDSLLVLNRTRYGDFDPRAGKWLNLTGLRGEDGFVWNVLPEVQARARELAFDALGAHGTKGNIYPQPEGGKRDFAVYKNVTGYVNGRWTRSSIEAGLVGHHGRINATRLLPGWTHADRPFQRNITGKVGRIRVHLEENSETDDVNGTLVRGCRAEFTIADETSAGDGWLFVMFGEHLVDSGQLILTTTSKKFSGIFALPHLTLWENHYAALQHRLNRTINDIIHLQEDRSYLITTPWTSSIDGSPESVYSVPNCDFVAYLHQHVLQTKLPNGAPTMVDASLIPPLETELRFPSGHKPLPPPPLTMSLVLFSPDCGLVLESLGPPDFAQTDGNHLTGIKIEVYASMGRHHAILFSVIILAQTWLLMGQMSAASTPSTRNRISLYTIGILALGDGIAGIAFLPLGMITDAAFPTMLATAFVAIVAIPFFHMRFLADIWTVQTDEWLRQLRQRQQQDRRDDPTPPSGTAPPAAPSAQNQPHSLPMPVTTSVSLGASPIILLSDQDTFLDSNPPTPTTTQDPNRFTRPTFGNLYWRFAALLLAISFSALHATSWPPRLRTLYLSALTTAYLSPWVPQIARNARRNTRQALQWRFVVGQSVLRLLPIAYFYGYADNLLFATVDYTALACFAAWAWAQIVVLKAQDVFGGRVGVPTGWMDDVYEWSPVLREGDATTDAIVAYAAVDADAADAAPSPDRKTLAGLAAAGSAPHRAFLCVICQGQISVPVIPASGAGTDTPADTTRTGLGLIERALRRGYMVTPCRHIFHEKCLEAAMRYRLQCPICREGLPPL